MQWEYLRYLLERWGGGEQKDDLNELGKEGWELVSIYLMSDERSPIGIFKRPIKNNKEVQGEIVATSKGFEIRFHGRPTSSD